MKMSDVFNLPLLRFNNMIHDSEFKIDIRGQFGTTLCELDHVVYAINNHDRLTLENARLREALRKLARASTEVVDISGASEDVFFEYECALDKSVALLTELEKGDE